MATRDADLSSLRINRSLQGGGRRRKFGSFGKFAAWFIVSAAVVAGFFVAKAFLDQGLEVQMATATLTSPSQANAVLTASGYVVAGRKAAVASKGTGRLVFLGVEEGDRVKKNQVIARLEDADVIAALARAKYNKRLAEADIYDARKSVERLKKLLGEGVVAQAEYDAAEARYRRVRASIDAATYAVKEAEVAVENTRIVAPFDGTVLKKNADVGEIVAPLAGAASSRAAVVTIADMKSLEVEADVSEANITRVYPAQNCEIRLDAYPEQIYRGAVDKIVPTADRAKATVMVKISFKEYDKKVLPEMGAKITFMAKGSGGESAEVKPLLTVPVTSVASRDGRQVVYQVKEGRAVVVAVVAGRQIGSLVEIKEGLQQGDRVIAKVDGTIKAGTKVSVQN